MAKAKKFGTGRAKRYDEGGDIEVPEEGTGLKKESFGDAFKRNRARGEKTFEFNGKKYTTEVKGEAASKPKSSVTAMRPTDEEVSSIKAKQAAASGPTDAEISRIKGLQANAKESRSDRLLREATDDAKKASSDPALLSAMPMGAAANAAKSLVSKGMQRFGQRNTGKIAERIEPTYSRAANKAEEFTAGQTRKEAAKGAEQRAVESQRNAARREAERTGEGRDYSEYKKGGKVKKMASGGKTKSASSRADGCAIRGKTRA